eukprot:3927730-Rhodomonas_salina.1
MDLALLALQLRLVCPPLRLAWRSARGAVSALLSHEVGLLKLSKSKEHSSCFRLNRLAFASVPTRALNCTLFAGVSSKVLVENVKELTPGIDFNVIAWL